MLMQAAALRIGNLLNQSELGRDVKLPAMTVHRCLNLLETSYQIVRLEPYAAVVHVAGPNADKQGGRPSLDRRQAAHPERETSNLGEAERIFAKLVNGLNT